MTVVELEAFVKHADAILGESGREQLVLFLAVNPGIGSVIPGTGGVRKFRWIAPGRGKRGGTRVIYFVHKKDMPLFALEIYAKNDRQDLSEREKKEYKAAVAMLEKNYRRGPR